MAKPELRDHRKFLKLKRLMSEPTPHLLGYLECLWLRGYQTGSSYIGDALDVDAVQAPRVPLVEVQKGSEFAGNFEETTPAADPPAPPVDPSTTTTDPAAYDLQALEATVRAQRTKYTRAKDARATWLGRVLDGEPLAPAGERDRTLNAVMSILAVTLPAGTPPRYLPVSRPDSSGK